VVAYLEALKLVPVVQDLRSEFAPGTVVRTEPEAGAEVAEGDAVTVYSSDGSLAHTTTAVMSLPAPPTDGGSTLTTTAPETTTSPAPETTTDGIPATTALETTTTQSAATTAAESEDDRLTEQARAEGRIEPDERIHTVVSGESISKIAEAHYGSADDLYMRAIMLRNALTITASQKLKLGAELVIPSKPEHTNASYQGVIKDCTWYEANREALNAGGFLATIADESELQTVTQIFGGTGVRVIWLGAQIEEGQDWADVGWITREPIDYDIWLEGEPSYFDSDGVTPESFLALIQVGDQWYYNDVPNNIAQYYAGKIGYVIEYGPEAALLAD